jgi:hypothetical protein
LTRVTRGLPMKFMVVMSSEASFGRLLVYRISISREYRAYAGSRRWMYVTKGPVIYATEAIGIIPERRTLADQQKFQANWNYHVRRSLRRQRLEHTSDSNPWWLRFGIEVRGCYD